MDILQDLNQMARERDIPIEHLKAELEEALAVSYKKFVGAPGEVSVVVTLDPQKGLTAFIEKEVVGMVTEPSYQMSITEARKRKDDIEIGDFVPVAVDPNRFGRIAAQTFKQVLNQKLREAEKRHSSDFFNEMKENVVSGVVTRREGNSIFVQINKVEAELPKREQVPTEERDRYRPNARIRVYVWKVEEGERRFRVIVSRSHPNLVRRLFEVEVPEIAQGIVQIKGVAREPGHRTKIAVISTDERIDPVGACVGQRGARVQAIVEELHDEKIDIVPFSDDPVTYITNALSPAKVNSIKLSTRENDRGEEENHAYVVVPDTQLSLAIGKGGQNVRLAAKLTEWKIDIRSESQAAEEARGGGN